MKKILLLTVLLVSFAGSAFAAAVTSNGLIGSADKGGLAVFGGVDATAAADINANPLVRFSTGVQGVVNFVAASHTSYAIITKHISGSKYFGTANDSTNVYWKQSTKGDLVPATAGTDVNNENFATEGWTAY